MAGVGIDVSHLKFLAMRRNSQDNDLIPFDNKGDAHMPLKAHDPQAFPDVIAQAPAHGEYLKGFQKAADTPNVTARDHR